MDPITLQVVRARRKLRLQQYFVAAGRWLAGSMTLAALGAAIPKLWHLSIPTTTWTIAWLGGGLALGLLAPLVRVWWSGASAADAALEIDRRFGLRERVSSYLSLLPTQREAPVGQALGVDARRQLDRVELAEGFPLRVGWAHALPLLPTVAAIILWLGVPDAVPPQAVAGTTPAASKPKPRVISADQLKRNLAARKKQSPKETLETAEWIKEIERDANRLAERKDLDARSALTELNNMASELDKRRRELGGRDALREQLKSFKEAPSGPADRMAAAMRDGDFSQANQELSALRKQLADGQLTPEKQRELAKQLDQFATKLKQEAAAYRQARKNMEEQIKQLQAAGKQQDAAKMQEKLDQLQQKNAGMERLERMANAMQQSAEAARQGNAQAAAQALDGLASDIQSMDMEASEMAEIDSIEQMLSDAKSSSTCAKCQGKGCRTCQGKGKGKGQEGDSLGEGRGHGDRPERKTDTSFYDTRVGQKVRKGKLVATDRADGPNRAGVAREQIKESLQNATSERADPLLDQQLPKSYQDHTRDYFDGFRAPAPSTVATPSAE